MVILHHSSSSSQIGKRRKLIDLKKLIKTFKGKSRIFLGRIQSFNHDKKNLPLQTCRRKVSRTKLINFSILTQSKKKLSFNCTKNPIFLSKNISRHRKSSTIYKGNVPSLIKTLDTTKRSCRTLVESTKTPLNEKEAMEEATSATVTILNHQSSMRMTGKALHRQLRKRNAHPRSSRIKIQRER